MAALELDVVKLMAKPAAARLAELVEMIRGLAYPKSGGARRGVRLTDKSRRAQDFGTLRPMALFFALFPEMMISRGR